MIVDSIFTKIIKGEIPCYKIAENDRYISFLDIRPLKMGHSLVVPKIQVDYIFDLGDDWLAGLFLFAKDVARAIESCVPCERIGISVIGLEVPHAHVHLIPINSIKDMDFSQSTVSLSTEEMMALAVRISEAYQKL